MHKVVVIEQLKDSGFIVIKFLFICDCIHYFILRLVDECADLELVILKGC